MIKKLQRKFIMIAMASSILVTCSICGVILIENYISTNQRIDGLLNLISENDGMIPEYNQKENEEFFTKETPFSTRYFIIRLNLTIESNRMEFIGRKRELSRLEEYYSSEYPQTCAIYGRRRCGKTSLVQEFCCGAFLHGFGLSFLVSCVWTQH